MQNSFSPSVNIVRDFQKDFYYVPTSNSQEVYRQISTQFSKGVHSYYIVGSYGTGKSAFLMALTKHLSKEQSFFPPVNGQFNKCKTFEFLNIVGEAGSFIQNIAEQLTVEAEPKIILKALKTKHKSLKKAGQCLVLLIDEFGKFLEYAAVNDPDKELYFIQQLAELANDVENNILFISTLHQNFDAYAAGLSKSQREEWEKVKGRLKELTFNEPIGQLLQLATERLAEKFSDQKKPSFNQSLLKKIEGNGLFDLQASIDQKFAKSLYPFDVLSAMILAKALQQYGQNERSLFQFLETDEKYGLYDYDTTANPYFNLNCVFDYLQHNYYSTLNSRYNPDYFQWNLLRQSIDAVGVKLDNFVLDAQKMVKAIGLLNLLGPKASRLNEAVLIPYAKHCLGIQNPNEVIELLERKKIIRYQRFNERFRLFEGTDVNIDRLIDEIKVGETAEFNLVTEVKSFFDLKFIPAKSITYKSGTPRFFNFKITSEPIHSFAEEDGAIDGTVNIIFNDKIPTEPLKSVTNEPILYGFYKDTPAIKSLITEIKVTEIAIKKVFQDEVAKKELLERKAYHIHALNETLRLNLLEKAALLDWYFDGKKIPLQNRRDFNKMLSTVCESIYPDTPVFHNELMNKEKVSSSIHTARKLFFRQLIENSAMPELGTFAGKMPAEKTIYQTLLFNTGIHRDNSTFAYFNEPSNTSFIPLWKASHQFLQSAKQGKRSVLEFIDILSKKPFKLKQGFIEFWVPTFLFIHQEDYALFNISKGFISLFSGDLTDLLVKDAKKYQIKTFDIDGIRMDLFNRYRNLINVGPKERVSNSSFKETARPFLVFINQLPYFAQQTSRISAEAVAFREVLKTAREMEKTFFEDLPTSFGVSMDDLYNSEEKLKAFFNNIQESIRELRQALNDLVLRIETELLLDLGLENVEFEAYKKAIVKRYAAIKTFLLKPKQKVFLTRLKSQIPNKEDWIKNIVQAVMGKKLEDINDLEEAKVHHNLKRAFGELDDLIELSKVDHVETKEEVLRVKLISSKKEAMASNIVLSPDKEKEVIALEKKIGKSLSKNRKINQVVLARLLQKYLDNE